ncbi:MAG: ATP-binding protein [Candidatus Obscuribacterales bacterium]|jgi:signal transduction histidine kinase/CheY-like chemotaxis protein/HPt (histidine-containing phosphotransfer) domain-containing protein
MQNDESEQRNLEQQLARALANLEKLEQELEAERVAHEEAISELKSSLAIKTEFIAHVNHELRTPLNGMLPMIEMILRSELNPEIRDYILTLRDAGLSLLSIINDVLDFTKIEAGKLEVLSAEFDLAEIVEGVAQILAPAAASKDILILSCIERNVPETIVGDAKKIRQVLLNLCSNAIKFTDSGQVLLKVTLMHQANGSKHLLFTVSDSGPGISEELMSHLFEPFFQGPYAEQNHTPGTGLGLTISKRLVELMSGKLFVESKISVGSTFGFTLPQEETANPEILKLWSRPDSSLPSHTSQAEDRSQLVKNLVAVVLEPTYDGESSITNVLNTFDLQCRSADSAQKAFAILAATATSTTNSIVVVLDMVRAKDECKRMQLLLKNSELLQSVKQIELVAEEKITVANQEKDLPQAQTIAMPMRRQCVFDCLGKLRNHKKGRDAIRASQSTTLGLEAFASVKAAAALLRRGEKKQALVADDNKLNQRVAFLFLSDLGFETDLVSDGIEAVQAFKEKHYDLVFLDCQMPRLDGFEAAAIIKEIQLRRGVAVPLIAVTANALPGTREECLAKGMDDYISKPIDPDSLEKVVTNWLGNSPPRYTPSRVTQVNRLNSSTFVCRQANFSKLRQTYTETQLKGILSLFRENCRADLAEIQSLQSLNEFTTFRLKLDRFKDCCEIIGAAIIVKLCKELSEASLQENHEAIGQQMDSLVRLVSELDSELESALADRSTYTLPTISNPK